MEALMTHIARAMSLAVALAATVMPAQAQVSAELAKTCRALMIKAVPTNTYGGDGTAQKQREYFRECVARKGDMPDAARASAPETKSSRPTRQRK
jgi:hypothetical protein